MRNAVLAAALAVAGVVGSVNTASAACVWGSYSNYTTSMNGSFTSGYAECATANTWAGVFRARTWMHGTCQLGFGCREGSTRRVSVFSPVNQCVLPGIGIQGRTNIYNVATGQLTTNALVISDNNYGCGVTHGASVSGDNWFIGIRCRIAHSC